MNEVGIILLRCADGNKGKSTHCRPIYGADKKQIPMKALAKLIYFKSSAATYVFSLPILNFLSDFRSTRLPTSKMLKHEIIRCERCNSAFECKANSFTKCQCTTVSLNLNETQYVSELYDGCLCANCLKELKAEYNDSLNALSEESEAD